LNTTPANCNHEILCCCSYWAFYIPARVVSCLAVALVTDLTVFSANPTSLKARQDNKIPSQAEILKTVSIFENIANGVGAKAGAPLPAKVYEDFKQIHAIAEGKVPVTSLKPSMMSSGDIGSGIAGWICKILGCWPGIQARIKRDDIPTFSPAAAQEQLEGWANGTVPIVIPDAPINLELSDIEAVTPLLLDLVTTWRYGVEGTPAQPVVITSVIVTDLAARDIDVHVGTGDLVLIAVIVLAVVLR
jgi:hypothetical protein